MKDLANNASFLEDPDVLSVLFKELYNHETPQKERLIEYLKYWYNEGENASTPDIGHVIWESYCGVDYDELFRQTWQDFVFWCEGVLLLSIGSVGIVGNIFSIYFLISVENLWSPFHHLLIYLSIFDFLFLSFSVPVHAFPIIDIPWFNNIISSRLYCVIYEHVLYPFSAVTYTAGVFMTVSISIERCHAVCFPHHYHNSLAPSTPLKRARNFIIPAVTAALIFNIHKFMEVETFQLDQEKYMCTIYKVTTDAKHVGWLKKSYIIHPFFTNTLVPILVLIILNTLIYRSIKAKRQNQPNTLSTIPAHAQASDVRQQGILVVTSIMFMLTHLPRLLLSLWAFVQRQKATQCAMHHLPYIPSLFVVCLEAVSNLLIHLNGSLNFLFYTFTSQQFKSILAPLFGSSQENTIISNGVNSQLATGSNQVEELPLSSNTVQSTLVLPVNCHSDIHHGEEQRNCENSSKNCRGVMETHL